MSDIRTNLGDPQIFDTYHSFNWCFSRHFNSASCLLDSLGLSWYLGRFCQVWKNNCRLVGPSEIFWEVTSTCHILSHTLALVYLVFGWKWMGKWWLTHINTMKFGGVACGKVFQTNPPCFVCFSLAPTWTLPWGMPRMWVEPDGYNLLSPMHVLVCGLMWFERTYGLAKWIMMNHDEPWWTMMNPITNHDSKSNRFREFESSSKIHDSWTVPRLFPHLLFLHLLQFLLSSAFRVCGDLYRFFWPKCGSCEVLIQRLDWEIWTKVI